MASFGSTIESPFESIERDLNTNFFGTLNAIRAFAPIIESTRGGSIVNVLSVVALASMPVLGGYSASKAAAYSLTQAIRAELASKGIRAHGVFPGPVDTDMARGIEAPKTSAVEVARAVLDSVERGDEDIFPDPMAKETYTVWVKDRKALERQFGAMAM